MKILIQGNPWWVDLRVDCTACGCVATLELENRPRVSYDPLSLKCPGVCCPICGEWIHVSEPLKPEPPVKPGSIQNCGIVSA